MGISFRRKILGSGVAAGIALLSVLPGVARAADKPFYEGKTITLVLGIGAGSGADLDCRMMAQYMGQYIPGNPTVIVKNMPGANGIIANNYVGVVAKKDGLTAVCGGYAPNNQLIHNPALQVDFTKFAVISGHGDSHVIYMRSDVAPGIKTSEDIFNANPHDIILGGFGVAALKDISARAFLATFGIDGYQYVTGFDGEGQGRAAVEQKFLSLWSESTTSYTQVTDPTLAKSGGVVPIVESGTFDAAGKRIRDPRTPNIPTYAEFYQQHFGKPPSGISWQVLDAVVTNINVALTWLALPPGSPPEAVAAMRASVAPLNHDPAYIADAAKLRGPGIQDQPGERAAASIDHFLNMPAEDVDYYNQLVASGTAMAKKK